ncbi:MAG TPA: GlsB/YeaQ/YmgE family stress response membrane protein [Anaerolineales bacterium]|nr:GlsB/YeaQ/YmgE family stress response membrane protein [Anaerolineales bacterium]
MTIEQIVVWIIVGGIAGLLADALIKGIRVGLVGAILIGILGAFIGGWLFGMLDISIGSGFISDVITAFVGAVLLLLLLKVLRRL